MTISQRFAHWQQHFYDTLICRVEGVNGASRRQRSGSHPISVAIPHYNRGAFIHQALHNVIRDDRVAEVIIVDDGSTPEQYELLRENVEKLNSSGKIKLYRRDENRGAMWTKMECVEHASHSWVILLDADNTLFQRYLDVVFALPVWDPDTIYCPSYAFPHFDFRELSGRVIDFPTACDLSRSGVLRRVYIINDGNYFLNRASYLQTLSALRDLRSDVADVIVVNYLWLSQGKKLQVMPGATYCHRLSPGSFWSRTASASRDRVIALLECFDRGQRWDDELFRALQTRF